MRLLKLCIILVLAGAKPLDLTRRVEFLLRDGSLPSQVTTGVVAPSAQITPFLKWAGGKRWLMPLATQLRNAQFQTYIEPFLGSGAMYFGLQPAKSILSDCNSDLIETYQAIADDWEGVVRHLTHHDRMHSPEYYYEIRSKKCKLPATKAARFIYLNRTCWNGLYRVNRMGLFNTPIGTKKRVLLDVDDFECVSKVLQKTTLVSGDFEAQVNLAGPGDLIFADPPYTVRHQYNGFVKYNERLFSWEDQVRLHDSLVRAKDRGASVLCTNADHSSIRELYGRDFKIISLSRYSSIAGSGGVRGNYAEIVAVG